MMVNRPINADDVIAVFLLPYFGIIFLDVKVPAMYNSAIPIVTYTTLPLDIENCCRKNDDPSDNVITHTPMPRPVLARQARADLLAIIPLYPAMMSCLRDVDSVEGMPAKVSSRATRIIGSAKRRKALLQSPM